MKKPFIVGFQGRVTLWLYKCFGVDTTLNKVERTHRFAEESLELVQATGCTREEVLMLVDYVYDRPVGEVKQEVGGTMVTLSGLCTAFGVDLDIAAETELARVQDKIPEIQKKHAAKPKFSPLPGITSKPQAAEQLLLPCPFCGKADTAAVDTSTNIQHDVDCECRYDCEDYFAVFCDASTDSKKGGCGASGGYQKTEALAIAVWNKRATPEPRASLIVEEIREYYSHEVERMAHGTGHYDGCWKDHWPCVLAKLLDEVARLSHCATSTKGAVK